MQGAKFGLRGGHSHVTPKPAIDLEIPAVLRCECRIDLRRHEQLRSQVRQGESRWHDADDLRRRSPDGKNSSDHAGIAPEAALPKAVAENHPDWGARLDRKSTRLNSSHPSTSYAVFGWKK